MDTQEISGAFVGRKFLGMNSRSNIIVKAVVICNKSFIIVKNYFTF